MAYKIRKVSKKQSASLREYKKVREVYLIANPNCERCGNEATDIHHKKGRIGNDLINDNYFMAVCRPCHTWIENNPKEAKQIGYSLNRLEK